MYFSKNHLIAFILFFFITSFGFQNDHNKLIGKWESVVKKYEKINRLVFDADNNFSIQSFITADYRYKLKGDVLIKYFDKTYPIKKSIVDTSYLVIKPDTIFRKYGRGKWTKQVVMIRDRKYKVKDKQNPLIGRWYWKYPAGHTAVSTYNSNGTMHLFVPRDKYKGKYITQKDTLKVTFEKVDKKQIMTYSIDGKLLSLKYLGTESEELYKKIK